MIKTILVVDDSKLMRDQIARGVQKLGAEVVAQVSDGTKAIHMYKHYRPDVVTMDLVMPNLGGVEAIQAIKKEDPSARILVISSLSDVSTALKAISCGAMGFLLKPFDEAELLDALQEMEK